MACWSAKSLVSSTARAVEDHGLDGLEILFVNDEPQEVGIWKKKKNEKIDVAQNMRAAKCFGDVPSIAAPSILCAQGQRSCEGV